MMPFLIFLLLYLLIVTGICAFIMRWGIRARDNNRNHESEQDWERP